MPGACISPLCWALVTLKLETGPPISWLVPDQVFTSEIDRRVNEVLALQSGSCCNTSTERVSRACFMLILDSFISLRASRPSPRMCVHTLPGTAALGSW